MTPLATGYILELARQVGGVSAFLGGFAATFLAMLLAVTTGRRAVGVAIVCAAAAATMFIVSTLSSVWLVAALHPDAPRGMAAGAAVARATTFMPFGLGLLLLLACLGLSGWARSRTLGVCTTAIAAVGAALALFVVAR